MEYFGQEKIFVTSYRSLVEKTEENIRSIYDFLGVEDGHFLGQSDSKANVGIYSKTRLRVTRLVNRMRYEYFHEGQRLRPKESIGTFDLAALRTLQVFNRHVLRVLETGRPSLQPEVRDRLVEYYREDAEQLRSAFNLDIDHWSVFSKET